MFLFNKNKKISERTKKQSILLLLYLYFALIIFLALHLDFSYIQLTIAFFAIPAIYLTSRIKFSAKIKVETLVFGFFCTVIIDHLASVSGSWKTFPTLNIKILNSFPIEDFIWGFSFVLLVLSLYEYIFDPKRSRKINTLFRSLTNFLSASFFAVIIIHLILPEALHVPYYYAGLNLIFIAITVYGFFTYPKIAGKISKTAAYLFLPLLGYELTSLRLNHFTFEKGFHIGYVELLGYTFPFEELLGFFVLLPTALLVIHEVFADNQK